VMLRTPQVLGGGAASTVLSSLAMDLLSDHLTTTLAPCALAGLSWSVGAHPGGLMIQAGGYSQRLPKLSADLARALASFSPAAERFKVLREITVRSLRNRNLERPLSHANYAVTHALLTPFTHHKDALAFATSDACSLEAVSEQLQRLLSANHVELLVHGNLLPSHALDLGDEWRAALSHLQSGSPPLAADCAPLPEARLLPARQPLELRGVAANADDTNSAIQVFFQLGDELSILEEAKLLLLAQVASKDAFNVLRTQRQLGYVVQCGVQSIGRGRGLAVLIQSSVMAPAQLDEQIEEWVAAFRQSALAELDGPTEGGGAAYESYKSAVITMLEEPPKTLQQEASMVWGEIVERTHRWDHDQQLADAVRTLSASDVLAFFDERIAAEAPRRRKVSSRWYSQSDDAAERQAAEQRVATPEEGAPSAG